VRIDGRGSQWAEKTFIRAGSQGLKLHLRIGAGSAAAEWVKITDMNVNDITAARDMPLEAGRIYLFDKGYCDYNWWAKIIDAGAHFITRLKRNAAYEVVMERPCDGGDILSDRIIRLTNHSPRGGKHNYLAGRLLRLLQVPHPAGRKQPFVIVSSLLEAPAKEIAEGYRRRWSIELVFKWLKQNLRIKRFLGESRNAVMTQIYVAIIAYVLVRKYHRLSAAGTRRMRLADFMTLLVSSLFHPHPQPAIPKPPPPGNQLLLWEAAA
jgi:IS4 transposase